MIKKRRADRPASDLNPTERDQIELEYYFREMFILDGVYSETDHIADALNYSIGPAFAAMRRMRKIIDHDPAEFKPSTDKLQLQHKPDHKK